MSTQGISTALRRRCALDLTAERQLERRRTLYHTLCVHEEGVWYVHFGDYSKSSVREEQRELVYGGTPRRRTCILSTPDTQQSIELALTELNKAGSL